MKKPILIAGPTASGKSALAIAIAEQFGGVIVNADSAQVYKELSIITARPDQADMVAQPHRLYGHVSGRQAYSTGAWVEDVADLLKSLELGDERAIIVGGTGLYFHALLNGLSSIPAIDPDVRAYWRAEAERLGGTGLHSILNQKDPVMANRLNPNDRQRLVRALEVVEGTGRSLAEWQAETPAPLLDVTQTLPFVLNIERSVLYERINHRFDHMVAAGAIDEVRAVFNAGFEPHLPMMRALGVPELCRYINGELSLGQAKESAAQQTRRYAKRQLTWLRRNMISWNDVNSQEMERKFANIFSLIYKSG